jgi:hypothetical protein
MPKSDAQAVEELRDRCRRQMDRPLEQRIRYGFYRIHRPVPDDAPWRAFESMADYDLPLLESFRIECERRRVPQLLNVET